MRYYFPIHLDGGNRGCEGIAKGTAMIIGEKKENYFSLCRDVKLDCRLGLDEYVSLITIKRLSLIQRVLNKLIRILRKLKLSFGLKDIKIDQNAYFFSSMTDDDVMISTGGDMMCYGDNTPSVSSNEYVTGKGYKSVLWGCSMGQNNISEVKEKTLRKFSLIYARESLSYEFFKSLGLKNIVCLPDPAFVLEPTEVELPKCFAQGEVIGLNLSNFTVGAFDLNTPFGDEVRKFIKYVIENTNMHILLIPHVFWKGQDDRIIAKNVIKEFKEHSDRISILDGNRYNYQELRYIISKCYCFIGGRTHAVISAYSTCTPAIALGYSIKSKGIAKDLGLSEALVVDCTKNITNGCLQNSFKYLVDNYDEIKTNLTAVIPEYVKRPYEINEIIANGIEFKSDINRYRRNKNKFS